MNFFIDKSGHCIVGGFYFSYRNLLVLPNGNLEFNDVIEQKAPYFFSKLTFLEPHKYHSKALARAEEKEGIKYFIVSNEQHSPVSPFLWEDSDSEDKGLETIIEEKEDALCI